MATIYLSSVDGNNADDGSTWALAKATLAAALTAAGAGGTVYVDDAHAETQASAMTLPTVGTAASPVSVLCVSRASGAPPTALATTAKVSTTGLNNHLTVVGCLDIHGVEFSAGDGANAARVIFSGNGVTLRNCKLTLANTNAASFIQNSIGIAEIFDCTFTFGHVSQTINLGASTKTLIHGGVLAGSVPASLFSSLNNIGVVECRGLDLSPLGSNTIVTTAGSVGAQIHFANCKLGSSAVVSSGAFTNRMGVVSLVNSDSADTNYRYHLAKCQGTITQETTIVRTGGASDGVTGFSREFVSSANSKFFSPLVGPWFKFWNQTPGSVTVEVEIVTDNVTLTDAEAWVEVEYQGTSGFPLSLFASDRAADVLATPANQTTSTETWTTTGLTTPVKQKLAATFTTAETGWVMARVMLAKASTTLYACPKILSTSARQVMLDDGTILNTEAASGGGGNTYSRGRVVNA
jgi:hypothetical protein